MFPRHPKGIPGQLKKWSVQPIS